MTRKKKLIVILSSCAAALLVAGVVILLITMLGGSSSSGLPADGKAYIGVQSGVYMGMTREELTTALGEPSVSYEEEDGITLVGYDELTVYGIPFRADYSFDETGLVKAIFITDYVELETARSVYNEAYGDVAAALSSQNGYNDEGTQGAFGVDERVYVYAGTETFTACVSYEYGMMTFTFMPKDIPTQ